MKSETWRNLALCKGKTTNDFYPEMGVKGAAKQVKEMKMFCRECPVILDCLDYALENDEQFGIWGGMTPKERSKIKKNKGVLAKETIVKVAKRNDNYKV